MSFASGSIRELTNARALDVSVVNGTGDQLTGFDPSRPASAALTSVASSTTSVSLLASNVNRRQFFIFNDSTKTLRIAYAATASATAFTELIAAKQQSKSSIDGYTGDISGIWEAANGFARIAEITT